MKKILSVLLVLAMVCAGTAALADAPYTPGTYTVSVDGHNGEICLMWMPWPALPYPAMR